MAASLIMKLKYKSGRTPLIKSKKLAEQFGFEDIYIKDESKNPFGTFKDRTSEFVVKKALEEYVDKLALITSGNAGYSLARFAEGTGIKVVCLVDDSLEKSIRDKLKKVVYKVIEVDLHKRIIEPEEVISMVRESEEEVIWDVTNGYHQAYESIVQEIRKVNPDYIVTPVGSGEGFVGLYGGIKRYKLKTKLIGIGVKQKWGSFADKLWTPYTPYKSKIQAIIKEDHKFIRLDEGEIRKLYKEFKNVINCEPSSSVVFSVFDKVKFKESNKIVLINTGNGNT